ncbi:WD repeat domain 1 [Turdus rufiventris]|nr:WD repeat domain 1 [Turdus rufiventris]
MVIFCFIMADVSGKLRIWDTTQKEHLLKYEYQPFAGKIKDLAWTEDSKRIAVVGEGREKFGAVFLWDSGSSVGEITGHNKVINSVDIKQTRPYRLATGSDDNCAAFFEGPPFKFKFTLSDHTRFVNCVRFSPDGNRFATASADGQIFVYDGKTGEKVCALGGDKAHDGGIYAISWSPDSSQLLSASGDKTAKIWDVGANSIVNTFNMGSNVLDQQLGCLWQKDHLLTISLSGYINYLDKNNPNKPLRVIKIVLMKDKKKCFAIDDLGYEPEAVAIHPTGSTAAVGGADGNVHLYSIQGTSLKSDDKTLEAKGPVTDLAYSHDGAFLAVCDANKVVTVFSVADGYAEHNVFYGHHAKVVCIAWSPDNEHFASGGMDMMVYVWTVSDPETRVKIPVQRLYKCPLYPGTPQGRGSDSRIRKLWGRSCSQGSGERLTTIDDSSHHLSSHYLQRNLDRLDQWAKTNDEFVHYWPMHDASNTYMMHFHDQQYVGAVQCVLFKNQSMIFLLQSGDPAGQDSSLVPDAPRTAQGISLSSLTSPSVF